MNYDYSSCSLCPRQCKADRSVRHGFCGLGDQLLIARAAPHLWEEPPVSGTRGTGAVFFSGCTLRCVYCQNGDISHRNEGRPFTPRELSDSLKRLTDLGVHTLSFITGTPFVPRILEALELWRPPLPLVWNTSGYETVDTLRLLEGVIDIYLPDLKHFSVRAGRLCAAAPDYFDAASAALKEMCRQTGTPVYDEDGIMLRGTLVRHLILPGFTSESLRLLTWIRDELPAGTPVADAVKIGRGGFAAEDECDFRIMYGGKIGRMSTPPPDYRSIPRENWLTETASYWTSLWA